MTDPVETNIDVPVALTGAARLSRVAGDFEADWNELAGRITGLHANAPWGNDEVGQEFVKQYLPEDPQQGASGVLTGLNNLTEAFKQLGPTIINSVTSSTDTDDQTGESLTPQ